MPSRWQIVAIFSDDTNIDFAYQENGLQLEKRNIGLSRQHAPYTVTYLLPRKSLVVTYFHSGVPYPLTVSYVDFYLCSNVPL